MYAVGVQPRHKAKCKLFCQRRRAFFDKMKTGGPAGRPFSQFAYTLSSVMASLLKSREMHHRDASPTRV